MHRFLVVLGVSVLGLAFVAAQDILYVSELLKYRPYQIFYSKAFQQADRPTWQRRFEASGGGVQLPVHRIAVGGRGYQLGTVCDPQEPLETAMCAVVVFATDNEGPIDSVGVYVDGTGRTRWVGTPPLELAEAVETRVRHRNFRRFSPLRR